MTTEHATQPLWALVELMGHQRMAGRIEEVELAGSGFLKIDVPAREGPEFAITRFVSPQAIYAINPVDEALAREMAKVIDHEPISAFDLPQFSERIRETIRQDIRYHPDRRPGLEVPAPDEDQGDEEEVPAEV